MPAKKGSVGVRSQCALAKRPPLDQGEDTHLIPRCRVVLSGVDVSNYNSLAQAFWQDQLQNQQNARSLKDGCLFGSCRGDSTSAVIAIELSGPSCEVIRKISKQTELGTFVVVLAAVSTLVQRYTNSETSALEIPRSGYWPGSRWSANGFIPFIVSFDRLGTFKDLLVEVQRTTSSSYRYQDFPVHQFAKERGWPLAPDVLVALSSWKTCPRPYHNLFMQIDVAKIINIHLSSPSRRFPRWFLEELGKQLDELIALFGFLDRPLSSFEEVLRERTRVGTEEFNRTEKAFSKNEVTVLDLFQEQVQSRPAAKALICGATVLSYEELDRQASRLATYLRVSLGITAGQVVAVLNTRSHWAVISLLGVLKAGAVYLPLNPQFPEEKMRGVLAESRAKAVVAHSRYLEICARLNNLPYFAIDTELSNCEVSADSDAATKLKEADLAYIIYTSGTTGVPKGVMIEHEGLANTTLDHIDRFQVKPADRYLQFMALSFDGFLLDTFTALCAGAALVIADETAIQDPNRLMNYIEEQAATISTITPSYLQLLDPSRISTLRILVSAGEVIEAPLARRLGEQLELYNGYGPTEATINSTLHRIDPRNCDSPIPIGRPSANKKIYVVNEQMEQQPPGVVGEICITGTGLAVGYLNDQKLTDARFIKNPFSGGGRLYRSGDFGAWSATGELLFKGRADNQVKVNGYRIDLGEIQTALETHPLVRTSEMLTSNSNGHGTEILAFYQKATLEPVAGDTLRQHLANTLPEYMLPHRFIQVRDWPLTAHGKKDTAALISLLDLKDNDRFHTSLSNPTEQILCEIWAEVLGRPMIGVDEDFFSLGGDSIRIIQATHKARQRGIHIDVSSMLSYRTVRLLSKLVNGSAATDAARDQGDVYKKIRLHLTELTAAELGLLPPCIEDAYPAALMQTFMIEGYQDDHELNGFYLGCAEWKFEDPTLSEEALLRALQYLYDTNRSLRAAFMRARSGRNLLLIKKTSRLEVNTSDLRDTPRSGLDGFFWKEIELETARRFDPYSLAPLIRFHLCRTGQDTCSLFISFHHALLDGWSGIELRNSLYTYYLAAKGNAALPQPADQTDSYKEFVAIEQEVLGDTPARRYWESEVTSDLARKSLKSFCNKIGANRTMPSAHATLEAGLPHYIAAAAIEYGQRNNTSIKALFLSSVSQAVLEIVGASDLSLAVVTNGRSDKLTEPFRSTGLFWNIVPFIIPGRDATSVRRVQDKLDEIAPFGHFPWKEIEEGIARQKLSLPVFNFVNFHNIGAGAQYLSEGIVQSRFHFPLTVFIKFNQDRSLASASLRIDFDQALFSEATARSLGELIPNRVLTTLKGNL